MGTRSDIIVHRADDKWARVYCHWDGYLDHNGRILFDHYSDQAKAEALVALGDLSSLGEEIGKKHDFEWRTRLKDHESAKFKQFEKMCLYYGRDRGEKGVEAKVFDNLSAAWPKEGTDTEFTYVFTDGKWWVGDPDESSQTLIDLGDALAGKKTLHPLIKVPFAGITLGRHK